MRAKLIFHRVVVVVVAALTDIRRVDNLGVLSVEQQQLAACCLKPLAVSVSLLGEQIRRMRNERLMLQRVRRPVVQSTVAVAHTSRILIVDLATADGVRGHLDRVGPHLSFVQVFQLNREPI